jgi:hypothetical protein
MMNPEITEAGNSVNPKKLKMFRNLQQRILVKDEKRQ